MRAMLLPLLLLMAIACGGRDDVGADGVLVGGRCRSDGDCDQRCLTGGDWPGGYCSLTCLADRDCPRGTVCVDKAGGVCLLSCAGGQNCSRLGPGYACRDKNARPDTNRKVLVCIGD